MKKKKNSFDTTAYEDMKSLLTDDFELMKVAIEARQNAYAPYSNFEVGAPVLLANGEISIGNNQENASFPAGLCIEGGCSISGGRDFRVSK